MDIGFLLHPDSFPAGQVLWSPVLFGALVLAATLLIWQSFAPARPARMQRERMDGYLERTDVPDVDGMEGTIFGRVLWPLVKRLLDILGKLAPGSNAERTRVALLQAGDPGHLSPLDFFGLRVLVALGLGLGLGYLIFASNRYPSTQAAAFAAVLALVGYFLPSFWLHRRISSRQHQIKRALPDALDMLTISVEAGLAFDSALLRVGEKWNNVLTQEFRRVVAEMRVGTTRDVALARMAERCGVQQLSAVVAVLNQSGQLGVSVADVLHAQSAEVRLQSRQRAEELAREAGVKMVFPLVFFILPATFIVAIGPAIPSITQTLGSVQPGLR
jgi:tight adherence protein C